MLAADGRCFQSRLATVLRRWTLGLYRFRLVLDFRIFLGLGHLSLWPLVSDATLRLVLVAGYNLGAVLGVLAS